MSDASGVAKFESVARRMAAGTVAGVVMFTRLSGHDQIQVLLDASRTTGVPIANGGKSGVGEITQALLLLEKRLSERAKELAPGHGFNGERSQRAENGGLP